MGKLLNVHFATQSQASADVLQKIVNGLESKVSSLQGELKSTQSTLQATQQEYDSYKVGSLMTHLTWPACHVGPSLLLCTYCRLEYTVS